MYMSVCFEGIFHRIEMSKKCRWIFFHQFSSQVYMFQNFLELEINRRMLIAWLIWLKHRDFGAYQMDSSLLNYIRITRLDWSPYFSIHYVDSISCRNISDLNELNRLIDIHVQRIVSLPWQSRQEFRSFSLGNELTSDLDWIFSSM